MKLKKMIFFFGDHSRGGISWGENSTGGTAGVTILGDPKSVLQGSDIKNFIELCLLRRAQESEGQIMRTDRLTFLF